MGEIATISPYLTVFLGLQILTRFAHPTTTMENPCAWARPRAVESTYDYDHFDCLGHMPKSYYDHPHLTFKGKVWNVLRQQIDITLRLRHRLESHKPVPVVDALTPPIRLGLTIQHSWNKVRALYLLMRGLQNPIDWLIVIDGPFATQMLLKFSQFHCFG